MLVENLAKMSGDHSFVSNAIIALKSMDVLPFNIVWTELSLIYLLIFIHLST